MSEQTIPRGRASYGPDGRISFFADPAMDRFVAVLLNVASELWVQTERVSLLSDVITAAGLVTPKDLAARLTDASADATRSEELRDYINRVFEPLREPAKTE